MKKSLVREPSLRDVLLAVNDLSTQIDRRFEGVDRRFEKIDVELFSIRANMATKQDILEVKLDIENVKNETMKSIDGFAVLCQKFDIELLALRSRFIRMEAFMHKVAERLSMTGEMA